MTLKNKINLSLIFFLILAIFLIAFLIYPLLENIKNNSKEIISQKKEILSLENKINDIKEFKKNYAKIKLNLEKIETLFTNLEAPIDFISFLEKTSEDCHLIIKIVPAAITKEKGEEPWSSLSFSITSAGSFPNFLRFLEKLESGPYLTEVQNLSIKRLQDTELKSKEFENLSLGDIQASFLIKVFAR